MSSPGEHGCGDVWHPRECLCQRRASKKHRKHPAATSIDMYQNGTNPSNHRQVCKVIFWLLVLNGSTLAFWLAHINGIEDLSIAGFFNGDPLENINCSGLLYIWKPLIYIWQLDSKNICILDSINRRTQVFWDLLQDGVCAYIENIIIVHYTVVVPQQTPRVQQWFVEYTHVDTFLNKCTHVYLDLCMIRYRYIYIYTDTCHKDIMNLTILSKYRYNLVWLYLYDRVCIL